MPLFDEIDKKQRVQILRATYKSLEIELFELLARLGIDFEAYVFGSHPEFADSPDNYYKRRIIEIEATLSTIEAKIAAIAE